LFKHNIAKKYFKKILGEEGQFIIMREINDYYYLQKINNLSVRPSYNVGLVDNNKLLNYDYGNGLNIGIGLNTLGNNNANIEEID